MPFETRPFDPARYLDSEEACAALMDEVRQIGDPAFIAHAESGAVRAGTYAAGDCRAYRIEDLPDELADLLEAGLDDLWNPGTTAEDGEELIG